METKKFFFILFLLLPHSPSPFSSTAVQLLINSEVHPMTFTKGKTKNPTGVNTFLEE